ncbi:TPA: hypothetical protein QH819_005149 [Escherichia coli]|nr:hypothetical protein [Escherichia coli]HDS9262012.1 hypothetical protein [Escherichia coli]
MQFLRRALDEPSAERCGKCSSCLQHPLLSPDIDSGLLHAANLFINEILRLATSIKGSDAQWNENSR